MTRSRETEVELALLHLRLLKAEEVGIEAIECVLESFFHYGPESVDVPRYKLHNLCPFSE